MSASPAELARDAEVSRAQLDLTIGRLEQRLTPLGLADEAIGFVRRSSALPVVEKGLEAARRNPLPILLIAAGAGLFAWRLMGETRHVTGPESPRRGAASNGFAKPDDEPKTFKHQPTYKGDMR